MEEWEEGMEAWEDMEDSKQFQLHFIQFKLAESKQQQSINHTEKLNSLHSFGE